MCLCPSYFPALDNPLKRPEELRCVAPVDIPVVARDGNGAPPIKPDPHTRLGVPNDLVPRPPDRQYRTHTGGEDGVEGRDAVHSQVTYGERSRVVVGGGEGTGSGLGEELLPVRPEVLRGPEVGGLEDGGYEAAVQGDGHCDVDRGVERRSPLGIVGAVDNRVVSHGSGDALGEQGRNRHPLGLETSVEGLEIYHGYIPGYAEYGDG